MDTSELGSISKDQISIRAQTLTANDVKFLVETLSEKDDKLRYNAFLLLQAYSGLSPEVYGYWDVLAHKLESDNSYQRSLGVMLIAENIHWDTEGKFGAIAAKYLACCSDEKFITARQTLQALTKIITATKAYNKIIADHIATLDFSAYKANQQSLLKKDLSALQKKL